MTVFLLSCLPLSSEPAAASTSPGCSASSTWQSSSSSVVSVTSRRVRTISISAQFAVTVSDQVIADRSIKGAGRLDLKYVVYEMVQLFGYPRNFEQWSKPIKKVNTTQPKYPTTRSALNPRHSPALSSIFEMLSTNLELPSGSSHSQQTQFLTHSLEAAPTDPPSRPATPEQTVVPLSPIDNANTARRGVIYAACGRGRGQCARCACSVFFIYVMPLGAGRTALLCQRRCVKHPREIH